MEIYIEDFLILHACIYFCSLLLIKYCLRFKASNLKLLLSSVLSSIFSIIFTFSTINTFLTIICKISIPLFALTFSFKRLNLKKLVQSSSLILVLSLVLTGAINNGKFLNGTIITSPIPLIFTLAIFIILSIIFKLSIDLAIKKKVLTNNLITIELEYGEKKIKKLAFIDTGNNLQFNNNPVSIINFKLFNELTNINLSDYLSKNFSLKNFNYINCSTVTGKKKMLMFSLDKMTIFKNGKIEMIEKPKLALSLNFNNKNYDLILNNLLI